MTQKSELFEGKYRTIRLLGEGGMGVVYEAEHMLLKRKCAVKVLHQSEAGDAEMIARFKAEAQSAANIRHPNIVEVMDFGITPDGRPFFVMEYLEGESLGARMERERKMRVSAVVEIIDQILGGLSSAHKVGLIHRDLKPDNIFLARSPKVAEVVKILDFGISKLIARPKGSRSRPRELDATDTRPMTEEGIILGTPGYMAPEAILGDKELDTRTDLFSVGILVYEMITGRNPFGGESRQQTLMATITKPVTPPSVFRSDLTWPIEQMILISLAKGPSDRFQSASEFMDYLTSAAVGRVPKNARICRTKTTQPSSLKATASVAPKKATKVTRDISLKTRRPKQVNQTAAATAKATAKTAAAPAQPARAPAQPKESANRPQKTRRPEPRPVQQSATRGSFSWARLRYGIAVSPLTFLALIVAGAGIYWFGFRQDPFVVAKETDPVEERLAAMRAKRAPPPAQEDPADPGTQQNIPSALPSKVRIPENVTIWLDAVPSTVAVMWDGRPLTMRPLVVPYSKEAVSVRFSAPGFEDLMRQVTPNVEQTLKIRLQQKSTLRTKDKPRR